MRRLALVALAALCGCDQADMVEQPKDKPYRATSLFTDGTIMRPEVPGTVPRVSEIGGTPESFAPVPQPATMDRALIERGQGRFAIFCTPCHGAAGDGRGMIVERGFPRPPSFHTEAMRTAPAKHFYDVITNGHGAMYSYATRVPPADRWAIAAYIRALQLSQNVEAASLAPEERAKLEGAP